MAEVRLEVELAHPRERVWRALTDARLLSQWLMPTDIEPVVGGRFTLEPGTLAGFLGQVSGELTELAPPERVVMIWQGEKLHTRVVWELTDRAGGCTLQLVQTGFIGAPATLRRRALRDTYTRLFTEQLPVVLERLAIVADDGTAMSRLAELEAGSATVTAGGLAAITGHAEVGLGATARIDDAVTALGLIGPVPSLRRQRRVRKNLAVSAWAAGRTLTVPAAHPSPSPRAAPVPLPSPRRSPESSPPENGPAQAPAGPERQYEDEPDPAPRPLPGLPAWARTMALGAGVAGLVVAVLLAVIHVPERDSADGHPTPGPLADRGPGAATQPSPRGSPEPVGPGATPLPPAAAEVPGSGRAPTSGVPERPDDRRATPPAAPTEPPESTGPPDPLLPPVLTATLVASDVLLLGVGGRTVTVTVSNPGPGAATGWQVTVDVGNQNVTNVSGANYSRAGSVATFTPVAAELAAGAGTTFSFQLPALLGAADPTGCAIDGRPCG